MTSSGSLNICAVILAAGESKRFGPENKLLAKVDGVPVLERVVKVVASGGVEKIIVVTGADHQMMASLLDGHEVEIVRNENWKEGMGTSLAKAAANVDAKSYSGILVCLGDLPYLEAGTVKQVIDVFQMLEGKRIIVPKHEGQSGHPLIFPISFRSELMQLTGDRGAKAIINRVGESAKSVNVDSSGIIQDIDRRSDLVGSDK